LLGCDDAGLRASPNEKSASGVGSTAGDTAASLASNWYAVLAG